MYETSIDLPETIKPGDKYQVTWNVELYKVTMDKDVGAYQKFSAKLSDGSDIQVRNPKNKILRKGDTIDVWRQKPSVNFTQQPAKEKLQKQQKQDIAKNALKQVQKEARENLEKCEKARKAKEEELENKKLEAEKKLETCEKALKAKEGGKALNPFNFWKASDQEASAK